MLKLARNEQCITLHPLTACGETGRKEQCVTLYPLTTRYFVGPFPAHVIFRPYQSPFILGIISSIRLITTRYCRFLLVGQIQPVVTVGPFVVR